MFLLYAECIILSNIETKCAGKLFSYTRQETLGPQILLKLDILRVFDILLFVCNSLSYRLSMVDQDWSVSIATCYRPDGQGISSRWWHWHQDPPNLVQIGYRVIPGIKRPGRGFEHPPHLVRRLKKE